MNDERRDRHIEARLREHYRDRQTAPENLVSAIRAAVREEPRQRRGIDRAPSRTLRATGVLAAMLVVVVGVVAVGVGLDRSLRQTSPDAGPSLTLGTATASPPASASPALTRTVARSGDIRRARSDFFIGGGGEGTVRSGELVFLAAGPQNEAGSPSFLVQHWGDLHGAGVYPPTRFAWVPVARIEEMTEPHEPECPPGGPTVTPVATLQPFERFICFGSNPLTFGPVRTREVISGQQGGAGVLSDDLRGDRFASLPYHLVDGISPAVALDRWVEVTGHFDDRSSATCGDAEAVTRCRELFVITAVREVGPPDSVARGTWRSMAAPPAGGRNGHAMVWTGTRLFVWGGRESTPDNSVFDPLLPREGLIYDPANDAWTRTAAAPIRAFDSPILAWTGSEILVVGGTDRIVGLAHDPVADTWRRLPDLPGNPMGPAVGAWLGDGLIVVTDTAAAVYRPATETWTAVPAAPVRHSWRTGAVASGQFVVIAFGDGATPPVEGAVFDPTTGSWLPIEVPLDPLSAGVEIVGSDDEVFIPGANTAFDPARNAWREIAHCPGAAIGGVWTGRVVIGVYGLYDPAADACLEMPEAPARGEPFGDTSGREFPVAVWTGSEYLTWSGGTGGDIVFVPNDGAIFRPELP